MARRYLALVFPWLPIERLRTTRPHLFAGRDETPVAFTETVGNATRLTAVNLAAARLGLEPGLTLADARARVPELEAFPADPHADLDWLERLAEGCARYSPTVALVPPSALVVDIAGCTHAFDGERPLAADVEGRMARRGILVRHAFGDTPEIALALARYAGGPAPDEKSAVRRLPVAALELDPDDAVALARAGLKTVGDVMARPLAGIAARFGADAATAVRRLSGEVQTPVKPWVRQAPVIAERRFAEPIARTEHVLAVLADLASEAAAMLETRHQGGRRWIARLFRADGHVQPLPIETGQPTRDVPLLMRLFAERIDALADPLDPGFGYDLVRLDVALAERLDAAQLQLEGGEGGTEQLAGLVDRLSTRLGRNRLRRFVPRDSHIPEQAELMLPATAPAAAAAAWPQPEEGEPPMRPIYLFDPPQPIESVMAEVPDGPPHRFRWRRRLHEVARAEGPERIAGEWWRRHDATIPTRDYYRVEDRRGRRFWIFRHGLHGETEDPRWYLHGLFA
ncbi:DNA polymerase Y family protein [uncultured Sphingomonas sp.]|uniref:Y-family DNA polymerase n=1 Tax=uncultured Sphingomonas sp. TaxID=158754 RepID=UPI0025967F9C|nr:DNA polymerase Y family protein [uncultured Sphingomonas sp.]